jgi:MFS transporter, PAT family, beta-lactamase induction signal transducer AmpG
VDSPVAPRPWLFGIASMPYGCFNGLVAVALPFLLRQRGVSVDRIATISATVQLPTIWYFLWAPVVDIKLRRRTWVVVLSLASVACAGAALASNVGSSFRLVTALLILASVFNQPVSSAIGGLVATVMPDRLRGRTGGWSQAGILGGGIAAGVLIVWLGGVAPAGVVALVAAAMIAVPAVAVMAVREPAPSSGDERSHLLRMARDTWAMLRRRDVWLGFAFFLSPIGAGALMNLFSAVGQDFHASSNVVILAVAIAGVLTPAGALAGGALADRFDRRTVYAIGGFLAAASVGGMLLVPLSPGAYLAGAAAYALATGYSYGAFMALAYSLLGAGGAASGTQFTLFMAAVNLPVVYMLRLDGLGHAHFGVRGMLAVDGGANLLFGLVLFLLARWPAFQRVGAPEIL